VVLDAGTIIEAETSIRLSAFFAILVGMALLELLAPRRPLSTGRGRRWVANLGLVVFNSALLRLAFPLAATGVALLAAERGWGLLAFFDIDGWGAVLIALVALDLAIYLQHRLFHAVPLLWRLHRVHHADLDLDVTSGVRFHPIEILISMVIKFAVIAALGAPLLAVIVFEVVLNATSLFNHSNLNIPPSVDRWLRLLVVTPDMHRVHHSLEKSEVDTNFGFNIPWWDRLFGTYLDQPAVGHDEMRLGIPEVRSAEDNAFTRLLLLPFR